MGAFPPALFNFKPMNVEEIASAVYNDVVSGLVGQNSNPTISMEQLEDEVVSERERVILEWWKKGILQKGDLLVAINCINVDCGDPTKCCNNQAGFSEKHFEIPQLISGIGDDSIYWIGSADRKQQYSTYYSPVQASYHKYNKRKSNKPYVYIERTPNKNGMYDGWIFNLPYVKQISVVGIFRDPRQLEKLGCDGNCDTKSGDFGSVSREVQTRLTKEKLYFYRQALQPPHRNDQTAR